MSSTQAVLTIAVVSIVTMLLRFIPFWVMGNRPTPPYVAYLGRALPGAIMGMLVVYCLRGVSFTAMDNFLPELISCAVVVLFHIKWRNTLLSIGSGTACYMLLVQLVF